MSNFNIPLKPLNAKSKEFEFAARSSLVALEAGVATSAHLVNFWVLADITQRIGGKDYAMTHAYSIKRLCEEIYVQGYKAQPLQYESMRVSVDVLIKHLYSLRNSDILKAAKEAIKELNS